MKGYKVGEYPVLSTKTEIDRSEFGKYINIVHEDGRVIAKKFRKDSFEGIVAQERLLLGWGALGLLELSRILKAKGVDFGNDTWCAKAYQSLGELTKMTALQLGWDHPLVRESLNEEIDFMIRTGVFNVDKE